MPGNRKKHRRGNGEGSIYQRKNGSWAAVVSVGTKADGKPNRKFIYGKTRKEVAEKLRDAQNKLDLGVMPGGDNVTFEMWILHWLEDVIKPGIKQRTYNNYSRAIKKHIVPGLGKLRLKDLSQENIQAFLTEQSEHGNLKQKIDDETGEAVVSNGPVAATTIIQQRRLIIAALEHAVDKGRLARNVAKKTRRPKSKPKVENILTDEDMAVLATKGTKYRYYAAYMLTLTTALRRGEVLGLMWKRVDIGIPWTTVDRYFPWGEIRKLEMWDTEALKNLLAEHNIELGDGFLSIMVQLSDESGNPVLDDLKTDLSKRTLAITEEMVLLLIFWRSQLRIEKERVEAKGGTWNPDNLVFVTRKGTPVFPRNFTKIWSNNLASMGIDHKRFHDLRHTVATVMLEDGEAMNTVQEQLGHYDAGFTASRYGHVTAKMKNSAAAKLGERLKTVRGTEDTESKITAFPVRQDDRRKAARKMK